MASCASVIFRKLNSVSSNDSYGDLDDSNLSPEEKRAKEAYYRSIFEMVRKLLYGVNKQIILTYMFYHFI